MKKSLQLMLILLVIFLAGNVAVSAPVSVETAKTVAANFCHIEASNMMLKYTSTNANTNLIYVFGHKDGFVIVSAEDRVEPILGYSKEGKPFIVPNDTITGNNFWGWVKSYEEQISYAVENNLPANAETTQMWEDLQEDWFVRNDGSDATTAVEPLLTTTWGQGWPYNSMCPVAASGPGGHVLVGCVGTAMAQILKFWNYPQQGLGSFGYQWGSYPFSGANFNTNYDWANMPNFTSEVNEEIATIMYHSAVSVYSQWGPGSTNVMYYGGEDPMTRAFKNYFKMASSTMQYLEKAGYTEEGWNSLLQVELQAGRPVYYRGDGDIGHAWVCDGYDDGNLYHFNFGWDGMYNGYYSLGDINPGGNNVTNNQQAIIGIKPNDGSTITQNTAWSTNMILTTNIWVADSITLSISPGAEIKFAPGCGLYVFGSIQSIGLPDQYIKLTAIDTTAGWGGVKFDNNYLNRLVMADNDTSRLNYTQVEYSHSSGLYCRAYGKLILDHCKINNNHGIYGAGVSVWYIPIKISYCEFYNNHASIQGGGMFVSTTGTSSSNIDYNNIHDNVADGTGGGFYFIAVNNVSFVWNTSQHNYAPNGAGGAILSGTIPLTNNKISNNITPIPGGRGALYLENCAGNIVNILITNNTGYGIFCINASPNIINSTIINNNANFGSGLFVNSNSDPYIKNCIIYGNVPNNPVYGNQITIGDDASTPFFDHSNIEGGLNGIGGPGSSTYPPSNYTNNMSLDPLFIAPSAGAGAGYDGLLANWQEQANSPCINAGDTTGVSQYLPALDLGGNPRISNNLIDMGAYEYCGPQPAGAISGNANHPCQSSIENYSVINVPGISYFWGVPAGWVINSGQGSNAIIVTVGSTSDTITVTPSNNCGNGSPGILSVMVSPLPAEPSAISGADNPCESSTQNYSVISVPEISYFWEVPTGWIINSGQGSNAIIVTVGSTSGNITVTPSNTCGNGTAGLLAVVVSPLPVQPSQPSGPVEVDIYYNPTSIYTTEASNAESFAWELTPQEFGTLNGNGASATITWSGLLGQASLSVKSENECSESEWSEPLIIQVDNSVGVEETLQGQITISPNPANGFIHFSGLAEGLKVSLLSLSGQMLMSEFVDADKRLDVSHIPAGMYFVKIEYKQAVRFEKVVLK